jgi:hypothetical protein
MRKSKPIHKLGPGVSRAIVIGPRKIREIISIRRNKSHVSYFSVAIKKRADKKNHALNKQDYLPAASIHGTRRQD